MTSSPGSLVRVGLIGCGKIAQQVHLRVLARLPNVTIAALADSDEGQRSKAAAFAPKARLFADYHELLEQSGVEAVVVALPSSLHADATLATLTHEMHVFVEKPLATTLADGKRILDAWKKTGLIGTTGFNYRFNKLYRSVKEHLNSGRLGRVFHARTVFTTPPTTSTWRQAPAGGGSALLDLGSHHIDLLHYFFNLPINEVYATVQSRRGEADTASLELTTGDGMTVQSFFSTSAGDVDKVEIYGEKGLVAADRYCSLNVDTTDYAGRLSRVWQVARWVALLRHAPYLLEKMRAANHEPSYRHILEQFVNAVQTGDSVAPTIEDGYRCLEVVAAAEESARAGRPMAVRKAV